jgi:hypothetical protein
MPGVRRLAPIRRGDLTRLVRRNPPGAVAIVDGAFHQTLAVGHAEIRDALGEGWHVWGLSSMGAIRACEMHTFGMSGWGRVFRRFCADEDFRDDEVALLHEPTPPYRAASEPLLHIREWLAHLERRQVLRPRDAHLVAQQLASMWFGDRTLARARALVSERAGDRQEIDATLAGFDRFRVKAIDLRTFLAQRAWLRPSDRVRV